MTTDAVDTIKAFQPDRNAWQVRLRGYVDWKFSELARYRGYPAAREYAESMRRWVNFASKYQDCLLNTTYTAFLEAEKNID